MLRLGAAREFAEVMKVCRRIHLEIRLLGSRNPGVLIGVIVCSGIVLLYIFSANTFLPVGVPGAQISDGRLPWHREGACILNGEFELQALVLADGIAATAGARPLFMAPVLRFFGGFVVEQPIALDHMQSLGVRSAETVDHGVF